MTAMASRLTRRIVACALDMVSPPVCRACAMPAAEPLCATCSGDLVRARHACRRCALPLPTPAAACGPCAVAPPPWWRATAACAYAFPIDAMIAALKYRGDQRVVPALGLLLARLAPLPGRGAACIVPVPLHRARRRQRGFNQAAVLAGELARATDRPLRPKWLDRTVDTPSQVGCSPSQRHRNVADAFRAAPAVAGRAVCLVDDVLTTGATLAAATRALVAGGAVRVDVVVLARAASGNQAGV